MQKNQKILYDIETYGKEIVQTGGGNIDIKSKFKNYDHRIYVSDFKILDKGCETWLEGHDQPMRFCLNQHTIIVHQFKKILPIILGTLNGNILKKLLGLIYIKLNWRNFLEFVYWGMRDVFYNDPDRYSQPVREIYRLIEDDKIRDVICIVLEQDDSYRFRFQDIIGELNKEIFISHPRFEIMRLWDIYKSREKVGRLKDYEKYIKAGSWIIMFMPKTLKKIKDIVRELNIDEVRLNEADRYWAESRVDYNFKHDGEIKA